MGVHIIATEDENGEYNTFIPENPNVKVHCGGWGGIIPKTATEQIAKPGQEKRLSPICGKKYNGYPF